MKTEAIRLCIQKCYGTEDYAEARKELKAIVARIDELEAAGRAIEKCRTAGHFVVNDKCITCDLRKEIRDEK